MATKKAQPKSILKSKTVGTILNLTAAEDNVLYFSLLNKKLNSVLLRGVEKFFTCENLLLPQNTLACVSQDILRLSSSITNGLRGTVIELFIRSDTYVVRIAKVVADSQTAPSTLLKVTLDEDKDASSVSTLAIRKGYTIERCLP